AAASTFASLWPVETADSELTRLQERDELDEMLDAVAERALLRVFEFEPLARRPSALSPLAAALADGAAAAGSPVEPRRLASATRDAGAQDDIFELAARLRVPIRKVTLQGRWWRGLAGPHVVFRGEQPLLALPERRGAILLDPSQHAVRLDADGAGALAD